MPAKIFAQSQLPLDSIINYCCLPMGINQSPDIAQEIMECVLHSIDDIEIYIDDIASFSNDFDSHMALLDQVFAHLQDHGFATTHSNVNGPSKKPVFLDIG